MSYLYCQNTDCGEYLGSLGGKWCPHCDWTEPVLEAQQPQVTVHSHTVRTLPNGDTEGFAFVTSPEIKQPQLLTDEELRQIRKAKQGHDEFARAVEQVVLRKNGVIGGT